MANSTNNSTGLQGWVKSTDPNSGRVFYANTVTRKTQWDPPAGWNDEPDLPPPPPMPQEIDPLPSNWEIMHDPSSGKEFYIDHARKITTWTRPSANDTGLSKNTSKPSPAATTSASNAFQRILSSASQNQSFKNSSSAAKSTPKSTSSSVARAPPARAYTQNSAYMHHTHSDVDFSDTLPALDFKVQKVADSLRLQCPHCDDIFTLSKRRHHCRLCGDVFCDSCSNHRVSLPLEGPEFESPVRICDFCNEDVDKGNFFTMRRYLTPLSLYEPSNNEEEDDEANRVATASNVAAALSALTTDLDSLLHNSSSFESKVTIPPEVLIPAITKHLALRKTSDRAIRALASLLALGSIVGNAEFAHAVFFYDGKKTLQDILAILERSGTGRKTLFVQEQAARAMFYLTDSSIMNTLTAKQQQMRSKASAADEEIGGIESVDMERALRSMLDHSSVSKNPSLQRWAAATIRNLVVEDQRRTCLAANDVAAAVASGEEYLPELGYASFLEQLVSTGGIMILCSLIGADDSDTRAHATGALGAVINATRAIDASLTTLREMTGQGGKSAGNDGDIIRAIVSSGGCGASLSQLLLSADNAVASMGCDFASALVLPLLEDPRGTVTLRANYDCQQDRDGLGACREAGLAIATGSCLPALLSLVRDAESGGGMIRPIDLRKTAMECLAAVVMAVAEMARANDGLPQLHEAVCVLYEEGVTTVALSLLESSSQSLVSSRETPAMRIREGAGIVLSSMTLCSGDSVVELESRNAVSSMLAVASEADMQKPSTLRGDAAPRCLGMLLTAATILTNMWTRGDVSGSDLLNILLEAIDAGALSSISRILFRKMDWESQDKSAGGMKVREACCRLLAAMFAIARGDETGIGQNRLYDVVDADAFARDPPHSVVTGALSILQTSCSYARKALLGRGIQGGHYHSALMNLVEAALLAVGSMCGSSSSPGDEGLAHIQPASQDDPFKTRIQEACKVACDIIVTRGRQGSLLPTMLVGGFGEGAVNASLRLVLAIAHHGNLEQHSKLAMSGLLVPISDTLRNALAAGDLFRFSISLALVRFCGPHVATGQNDGLQSVRDAIRVATNVLTLPVDPNADSGVLEMQESLKSECISTLEALSNNASLWSAISQDALPSIVGYLHSSSQHGVSTGHTHETRCAALRAILKLVQLPAHAISAAKAGLAAPLAVLLKEAGGSETIPLLALEILHLLVSTSECRRYAQLVECGGFQAVCTALGKSATHKPNKPTDSRADIAFWGLEILRFTLDDIESSADTHSVLQSSVVRDLVDIVGLETQFLRSLCATLLLETGMLLPRSEMAAENERLEIPKSYGPPLVLVQEACSGSINTHEAAKALLFSFATYAASLDSQSAARLWSSLLGEDLDDQTTSSEKSRIAAAMCAHFLSVISEPNNGMLISRSQEKCPDFQQICRPLVQHRLLEQLKSSLIGSENSNCSGVADEDEAYMRAVFTGFRVPQLCLALAKDHALFRLAYDLTKSMISVFEDDVLPLFVDSKSSMVSLFDMLILDVSQGPSSLDGEEVRRFVATILGSLAQSGLLAHSVEKFGVRSEAVAALAAACLAEDEVVPDDVNDEEATSSRTSSRCMACLVELCTVESNGSSKMQMSEAEAVAIAQNLGKKMSRMVISRFLERAKLEQYDVKTDDDIMEAPDVVMLCAMAQQSAALEVLGSIGGLHALSLIAAEGDLSAIIALQKACEENPSLLLEVEGQKAIMALFEEDSSFAHDLSSDSSRQTASAAFGTLAALCNDVKGRHMVTSEDSFPACLASAIGVVTAMIGTPEVVKDGPPDDPLPEEEEPPSMNDNSMSQESDEVYSQDAPQETDEANAASVGIAAKQAGATPANDPFLSGVADIGALPIVRVPQEASLECAAVMFVCALVPTSSCRTEIIGSSPFVSASLAATLAEGPLELKYELIRLLSNLAPFASVEGGELSVKNLADVCNLLVTPSTAPAEAQKLYPVQGLAADVLAVIYDSVGPDLQHSIARGVAARFVQVVKTCTVTRAPGTAQEKSQGAKLVCNLSMLLLQSVGNDAVRGVLSSSDLLTSMIRVTQWRCDPKAGAEAKESLEWDATLSHCLQFLAFLFCGTRQKLAKTGVRPLELSKTVLMMTRPGRAPRKAIDFPSALRKIVESPKDASSCIAARRILGRLNEYSSYT